MMHRLLLAFYASLALFALIMVYQFVQNGQNGRYQFKSGEQTLFLDTRTGVIYAPDTATVAVRRFIKLSYGEEPINSRRRIWGTAPIIYSQSVK